jgi:hypothetical protein
MIGAGVFQLKRGSAPWLVDQACRQGRQFRAVSSTIGRLIASAVKPAS